MDSNRHEFTGCCGEQYVHLAGDASVPVGFVFISVH